MYLSGNAMTTTLDVHIHPNYTVDTKRAMKWFQCEDGNWYAVDRGANSDIYEAQIDVYDNETNINNYLDEIKNMRDTQEHLIIMSGFALDERIFGEDIDYSDPISGIIMDIGDRKQRSFKGFSTSFTLRALSPAFSGVASLPNFANTCLEYSYSNIRDYAYTRYDTYYGDMYVTNRNNSSSIFRGTFNLSNDDLRDLRRWYATNRDTSFSISDLNGIDYMFGPEEGTYNHQVKILKIKEKSKHGLFRWIVEIDFAKVY